MKIILTEYRKLRSVFAWWLSDSWRKLPSIEVSGPWLVKEMSSFHHSIKVAYFNLIGWIHIRCRFFFVMNDEISGLSVTAVNLLKETFAWNPEKYRTKLYNSIFDS